MAACSQLPRDVWGLIGQKLHDTADQIRYRSVCRTCRSALPFPQPPWLMLAEDTQSPNTRGFFGLGQPQEQQKVYQFELPEAHLTRCIGSTGTWLITVDGQERIRLLNPFSRLQIDLPSQRTFEFGLGYDRGPGRDLTPVQLRDSLLHKAIMSSPPTSSSIVMVIHHCWRRLAIARPGDASWTTVTTPKYIVNDIIFYKHQFYAIDRRGILMVCDLGDHLNPPKATMLTTQDFRKGSDSVLFYLVEWMEELLFVIKFMDDDDDKQTYKLNRFEIYLFDFTNKIWTELKSLGEYSLFLGHNTSAAVLASDYPGLKKNCIYFTDDYAFGYRGHQIPGGTDMGVFDFEDKTISPHYKGKSTCLYSPPLWIVPQIHQSVAAPPLPTELD